jgi:DNA-binding beta-propeller fold protein YncE
VDRRQFLLGAAALVAAPSALAGGAGPVALVTADLEAHVVVFDLARSRVVRRITTPPFPRSIETVGTRAVVAHPELGAVSILDARRVLHVLRGLAQPRYTAAHPDGRHAYVTDARRGDLVALDVVRGRVVGRAAVGPLARHVSFDPFGLGAWVALGSKAREVAVVDVASPDRPRLVERLRPPFLAHDVAVAPDAAHVWVSSGDRNELAVYRRDGRLLGRVSGDWPPQHVSFGGGLAFVTSGWSGTLGVHRVGGARVRRTVVPVGSYNVQCGAGRVVTPGLGTGTLAVLDDRGALVMRPRLARSSHDACVLGS